MGALEPLRPEVDVTEMLLRTDGVDGKHVFVPFLQTYTWVTQRKRMDTLPRQLYRDAMQMFSWHTHEVEVPVVCLVLAYRIGHAERRVSASMRASERDEAYRCQLFVDQHLDLLDEVWSLLCQSSSSGSWLDKAEALSEERMFGLGGLVHVFMPSHRRAPCSRRLPDVVALLPVCDMRYDLNPDVRGILKALCHLLSKATNHNCLPRNTADIMRKYACAYPVLGTFIQEMLQVSLLGNYPHARVRPPLWVRVAIRRGFRREYCPATVFGWISRHDKIARYCTREFYVHCLSYMPLVETHLMNRWCDWDSARAVVLRATDSMRMELTKVANDAPHKGSCRCLPRYHLEHCTPAEVLEELPAHEHEQLFAKLHTRPDNQCLAQCTHWMAGVATKYFDMELALRSAEAIVVQCHQMSLNTNHKLHKGHWTTVFLHRLSEAKQGYVHWTHSETSRLNYQYYIRRPSRAKTDELAAILQAASEAERKLPGMGIEGNFAVTRHWLSVLGLRDRVIQRLERLHSDYLNAQTSDNSLCGIMIDALSDMEERDLFIAYLLKVHGDICNDDYALPPQITQAQHRALRAWMQLAPWQPDPEGMGLCALCERCEEWHCPVAGVPMYRNLQRKGKRDSTLASARKPIYANGICKTIWDRETGLLHCKKKRASMSSKRRRIKNQFLKVGLHLTNTQASEILKREEGYVSDGGANRATRTCCDYPITFVQMIGRARTLRGCTYVMCAYCGVLTYLHAKTAYPSPLPNCGMHDEQDMNVQLSRLDDVRRQRQWPCIQIVLSNPDEPLDDRHPMLRRIPVLPRSLRTAEERIQAYDSALSLSTNTSIQRDVDRRTNSEEVSRYPNMRMQCVYCRCKVRNIDATLARIWDFLPEERRCIMYPAVLCRKCASASYPYRKHQAGQFLQRQRLIDTIYTTNSKNPVRRKPWMRKRMKE